MLHTIICVYIIGSVSKLLDSCRIRVIVTLVSFGTFFLSSSYSCNLKAIFTVSKRSSRPESLTDALQNPNFQIILANGSSLYARIHTSNNGIYQKAWNRIQSHPENVIIVKNLIEGGLERIHRSPRPIGILTQREIALRYIDSNPDTHLYVAQQHLYTNLARMVYKKGFPYAKYSIRK